MGQPSVKVSGDRLPAELAAALEPRLRRALDNPVRREILRVLNESEHSLDVQGIANRVTNLTVSETAYHLRVLEDSGAVADDGGRPGPGGGQRLYLSGIAEDLHAMAALRATRQWDRDRRRSSHPHTSRLLTTFRIPRPALTVRLGDREWREREGRD